MNQRTHTAASAESTAQLDPEFAAVGQQIAASGLKGASMLTDPIADVRRAGDAVGDFLARGSKPVDTEEDVVIDVPSLGAVRARLYRAAATTAAPLLVYMHGGGFAQGSLPTWTPLARHIVRGSGAAVLSVDYSLAPENPFPRALHEVIGVVQTVPSLAGAFGIDAARIALGGDSAGANLALSAAMALRDAKSVPVRFLLLFYGVYSADHQSPAWGTVGDGRFGLSVPAMKKIWSLYTGDEAPAGDWRKTPLEGRFEGLPPAWACVGTLDPLIDDNRRLQDRMRAAGGACELRICEGLPHAFVRHVGRVRAVDAALDEGIAALRDGLR